MSRKSEFQAVVLAGGNGSRMTELTSSKLKCLLPIGNKLMICYPLNLLEEANFPEIIIVVASPFAKVKIEEALQKYHFKAVIKIVVVPRLDTLGTVDAIGLIADHIYTDVVVVSCDLITNASLSNSLNLFRKHKPSMVSLMFPSPTIPSSMVTPGLKEKQRIDDHLIGIEEETNRLVFFASTMDFQKFTKFSKSLLEKFNNFTMHSKLLDAHLYIFDKWIINYLAHVKKWNSLKGDFIPYLVKSQLKAENSLMRNSDEEEDLVGKEQVNDDIFTYCKETFLTRKIREMSYFNDHSAGLNPAYHNDQIRCYAYVETDKNVWACRANTIQMYSYANKMISHCKNNVDGDKSNKGECKLAEKLRKESEDENGNVIASSAVVKCTQLQNCNIDENTFVDEKTSLSENYIGTNVKIDSKTKLTQCIVMDNVTINERCTLENCILCSDCVIKEGSRLKNCVVTFGHQVPSGSNMSNEMLIAYAFSNESEEE